jgi:TolB-like protein
MGKAQTEFGPFLFDASRMELMREGATVSIGSRAAALLNALLTSGGEPVSKDALFQAAWPGSVVEESNLVVQIAALRKALGKQQSGHEWIITVPRFGYRMPVSKTWALDRREEPRLPTLAVLPFANLSVDEDQEYLADGIVEDITTALSRFKSFAVVSRNSAHVYRGRAIDVRQVGKELDVHYVLEGAVRSAGDRIRINAQLVEAENGKHIWGQRFDVARTALFDAQDQVTDGVVGAIQPSITRTEVHRARIRRTNNSTAYDLYLRALPHLFYREGQRASDLLEEALRLDPDFALAATIAGTQYLSNYFHQAPGSSIADRARGIELLNRVLPRCASDSTLLSHCGLMLMILGEYDRSLELALRAVAENPHDSTALSHGAVCCLFGGDLGMAAEYQLRALSLSPNEYFAHGQLTCVSHIKMCERNFEEAIAWAVRSLAVSPHYTPTYWMLAAAHAQLNRLDEARRYLAELVRINPTLSISKLRLGQHARDPWRVEVVFQGLRLAGLPEG